MIIKYGILGCLIGIYLLGIGCASVASWAEGDEGYETPRQYPYGTSPAPDAQTVLGADQASAVRFGAG